MYRSYHPNVSADKGKPYFHYFLNVQILTHTFQCLNNIDLTLKILLFGNPDIFDKDNAIIFKYVFINLSDLIVRHSLSMLRWAKKTIKYSYSHIIQTLKIYIVTSLWILYN
jgi:hypothetical protein